jgi:hypothetical protein
MRPPHKSLSRGRRPYHAQKEDVGTWEISRLAGQVAIAKLSQRERFQWLIAPRSPIIQTSAVHTGILTKDDSLADRLERLFEQLVGVIDINGDTRRADRLQPF